jgi:hypothetical protein
MNLCTTPGSFNDPCFKPSTPLQRPCTTHYTPSHIGSPPSTPVSPSLRSGINDSWYHGVDWFITLLQWRAQPQKQMMMSSLWHLIPSAQPTHTVSLIPWVGLDHWLQVGLLSSLMSAVKSLISICIAGYQLFKKDIYLSASWLALTVTLQRKIWRLR